MAAQQIYKRKVDWDQAAFRKMRATWSPERKAEDRKILRRVFNKAAASPTLAAEMKWAKAHGIKFFIDRTAVNCGGYYTLSTGVVAIGARYAFDDSGMEVLAHELRHAWQDYHGLIACHGKTPKFGNFSTFFINNAMIEADAMAYGQRVRDEIRAASLKKRNNPVPAGLQTSLDNENADLGKKFLSWFGNSFYTRFYGDFFSKAYGRKWGLYEGELPLRNFEHPFDKDVHKSGFDTSDRQDVLRLGVNFSGTRNYLADLPPEVLPRRILSPSLARTFWGAANNNQRKLTTALERAYMEDIFAPERVNGRLKATRSALPRHPWP
ncbi:MAG: hypothetical protein KGL10_03410 [Alphaproteobacteria bacterium]|nr:hypothetical protein [Alphaproteobacteria bacterium]